MLAPQIPYPPRKGTAARNFHLLKHLAAKHDVHLLAYAETAGQQIPGELQQLCANVRLVPPYRRSTATRIREMLTTNTPDLALRLADRAMTDALADMLHGSDFNVLQIEGLEMFIHWERIWSTGMLQESNCPLVVLDDHNCEYLLQKRAFEIDWPNPLKWPAAGYSLLQWQRLVRYEARTVEAVDGVIFVSEEDREALSAIAKPRLAAVVQNGVDTALFARQAGKGRFTTGGPNLVFTGTMDFRPNVDAVSWFCQEIFGYVRREVPAAKFWIVGANPTEEVKRLSRLRGVIVTGLVDDIRQFLSRATVYVVPMRFGGGVRFKVLEAMAAGLPIVSTSLGYQGIQARDGIDLLVADGARTFAEAVIRLINDGDLRQRLEANALKLATQKYDWQVILPRIDDFYSELEGLRPNSRGNAGGS